MVEPTVVPSVSFILCMNGIEPTDKLAGSLFNQSNQTVLYVF